MMDKELNNYKNIHLIGIGGISMSAIARLLDSEGLNISGSDTGENKEIIKLKSLGIKIYDKHSEDNVKGKDLVIYSRAIKDDNPEIIKAKELKIKLLDRSKALGIIMNKYKNSIAISGSHGKTTTTSIISLLLIDLGLDPTIMVGGSLKEIEGNLHIGSKDYFITEACEYYESFLNFNFNIGIILNIDLDHLDYFKSLDEIKKSFLEFANKTPKDGILIACGDDENFLGIKKDINRKVFTYGIDRENDLIAHNIEYDFMGRASFNISYNNKLLGRLNLKIPGKYNVYNVLAAISLGLNVYDDFDKIKSSIEKYNGIDRRFQFIGNFNNMSIIDDYGHHPNEIKATLDAAKNIKHNKIWTIFQPHTYTRTLSLFDEFAKSFINSDNIIITDIYAAREKDTGVTSSKALLEKIKKSSLYKPLKDKHILYLKTFEEIVEYIKMNGEENDIVITMGAGDINKVAELLVKE